MRGMGRFDPDTMDLKRPQDIHVLRMTLPFLWPKNDWGLRARLLATLVLLVVTSVLNTLTPVVMARVVDTLAGGPANATTLTYGLLLAYGVVFTVGRTLDVWRVALYGPMEQRLNRSMRLAALRHTSTNSACAST